MSIDVPRTEDELTALAEAERGPSPFVVLRDDTGRQRIVALDGDRPRTIGRRPEADISLPWDRQVSRVHAELRRLAGEWTIVDDGLSQNGTYVNEVRLMGRRRLSDGDHVRLGRTQLAFRDPSAHASSLTLLPGELNAAVAFSEQQHRILRELCRPYASSGEDRVRPASDRAIAAALRLPVHVVATEMEALTEAFGMAGLPEGTARKEVARSALMAGIVSLEDLG
jgi:pSer/pThr/pTyr-binding forkhead associated (FHA) protein